MADIAIRQDPQLMEVNPPLLRGAPSYHDLTEEISSITDGDILKTPLKYWITLSITGSITLLLAAMLIGFGTAGTAFGSIVIASRGVPDSDQGVVGGMINTSRQIGAAIGAALLPAVALGVGHEAGVAGVTGDRAAMLAGAVASVLAMLLAWRASRAGGPVAQPR